MMGFRKVMSYHRKQMQANVNIELLWQLSILVVLKVGSPTNGISITWAFVGHAHSGVHPQPLKSETLAMEPGLLYFNKVLLVSLLHIHV
jgi:hypothetical protein